MFESAWGYFKFSSVINDLNLSLVTRYYQFVLVLAIGRVIEIFVISEM